MIVYKVEEEGKRGKSIKMKKKLLISLLALSGVAALASCGDNDKPNSTTNSGSVESSESSKSTPSKSSESVTSKPSESSSSSSSTTAPEPSSSSSSSTTAPQPSSSSSSSTTTTPSESSSPSSSVEAKAKVTFDVDGVKNEVLVSKGNVVSKPDDPTKDGYVFVGWFNGDEEFDFSAPILTDEVNLVAKFRELTNKELFYKNGEVLYYSEFDEDSDVAYSTNGGDGLTGYAQDSNKENKPFSEANIVNIANGRLNLVDTDAAVTTYASIDVTDVYLDKVTFVCDVIPGKVAGKWSMVTFVDVNGSEFASIRTTSDKKLGMRVAGVEPTTGVVYTENQSMKVVVVIDLCEGTISATIDGTTIASDAKINVDNFSGVKFGTAKDARNLSLDNVGIKKEECSLDAAKAKVKASVDDIYTKYDFTAYQTNQENITNAYNQAKASIDNANSVLEVRNALETFKEDLKKYPSDAEIALNQAKANAIAEISSYLDENNYTYSKDKIADIISKSTDEINKATSVEAINELVTNIKADLDQIPNDEAYLNNVRTSIKSDLDNIAKNYLETEGFAQKIAGYKDILDTKTTEDEIIEAYNSFKLEIAEIPTDEERAQSRRKEAMEELIGNATEEFSEDLLVSGSGSYRVDDILALKDTNNDVYQLIINILSGAKGRLDEASKTSDVNDVLAQIKEEIDNAIASTSKTIEEVRAEALTQIKDYATEKLGKDTFKDYAKLSEAIAASDNVAVINQIVIDGKEIVDVWAYIATKGVEVEEAFNIHEDADYKAFASAIAKGFNEEEFAILVDEEGRYAYNVDETTANIDNIVSLYKENKLAAVNEIVAKINGYFEKYFNTENETVATCVANLTTFKGNLATSDYVAEFNAAKDKDAVLLAEYNVVNVGISDIMRDAIDLKFSIMINLSAKLKYQWIVNYGEKIDYEKFKKDCLEPNNDIPSVLVEGLYYDEDYTNSYDLSTVFYNNVDYELYAKSYAVDVIPATSGYGFVNPTVATPDNDDVFTFVGINNGVATGKSFTDTDGTTLTSAIKTGGNTKDNRYIKITLTETKTLKVAFFTGSGGSERSVFIGKTASKTLDTSIAYGTSSVQTEVSSFEVELAAGEYYVNFTANVSIFRLEIMGTEEKMSIYNSLDITDVKTTYASGETIDLSGLKVTKTTDDVASTVELTEDEMADIQCVITNEEGFVVNEQEKLDKQLTAGTYKVTIIFKHMLIAEYEITVE